LLYKNTSCAEPFIQGNLPFGDISKILLNFWQEALAEFDEISCCLTCFKREPYVKIRSLKQSKSLVLEI
jgi:hypothetical protein